MILRGGSAPVAHHNPPWPARIDHMARAGGMTGLGMNIVTLDPGQRTSERHWHSHSDEALFVLYGHLTVIEDDGPHLLSPGDSAIWPAGTPNAHTVENRSDVPARFLITGTNPREDTVHYPDLGQTRHVTPEGWRLLDADGTVLDSGPAA